ncbi:unnamed protein product [Linum trigynum]|uniref:C3H1-type domain-containing protein n=1 Tax=Linum trigynum TaxID=586398 RepID=A0AAV2EGH7_9ROSI
MCCDLGRLEPEESPSPSQSPSPPTSPSLITLEESSRDTTMNNHHHQLTISTEDALASLLELAANDDVESFKLSIERDPCCVDEIGLWYCRRKGSKQMVNEQRTPLMVAATYGSVGVMKLILAFSQADINQACGVDSTTALHCAASGGAASAVDAVKLLLSAGADPNVADGNGLCPVDVIVVPPRLQEIKLALEQLLSPDQGSVVERSNLRVLTANTNHSNSPPLSPSMENNGADSPMKYAKLDAPPALFEKKEYPIDPSLPDIKNSVYSTDEFRMYSFKVRPCSRAYSHDWTECPFVHPGENARRRDPRKFHYSCVPCPDFRKGACRRGDMCEYAHGVFECWLHPAQYRTRLCKDGTNCARRVCFFAHTVEELRPLYVSTGSAVPSPRSTPATGMDFAAAMSMLPPGSPSSPFTPPMSPSGNNGMSNPWGSQQQQPNNVPALHLPAGSTNLQSSRLRSSLHARDIPNGGDYNGMLPDFDMQIFNELSALNNNNNSLNRSGRMKILTPSNLDDLFSAENSSSSPRYGDQGLVFSPTHKSSLLNHQFQQQQNMLSPINTNFSPRSVVDHPGAALLQQMSSPREPISPMSARISLLAQREKQQLRSLSSRELGSNISSSLLGGGGGSPVHLSRWGSSSGRPDWTASADELGKLRRSNSFELESGDEPDLSWVQSLVKESPSDMKEKMMMPMQQAGGSSVPSSGESSSNSNLQTIESIDNAMGAWIEQLQIDQLVAQQN